MNDADLSVPASAPMSSSSSASTGSHSTSPARPPSSTAVPLRRPRSLNRRARSYSADGAIGSSTRRDDAESSSRQRSLRRHRRRRSSKKPSPALTKKLQFITNLLTNLDSLVYVQLATLYYMECSLILFFPRAVAHYTYLTPQPESLGISTAAPANLLAVLIPNILALAWHLFTALPVGSEMTRGYMHGGVIVDFIGQMPPTTRLIPMSIDIFILLLQLVMLAVHLDRDNLRTQIDPKRISPLMLINLISVARVLDQAERGVLPPRQPSGEDLSSEQQSLLESDSPASSLREEDLTEETRESLMRATAGISTQPSALDELWSGTAVVGEYNLVGTFKKYASAVTIPRILRRGSSHDGGSGDRPIGPGNYTAALRDLGIGGFARLLRARRTTQQTEPPEPQV